MTTIGVMQGMKTAARKRPRSLSFWSLSSSARPSDRANIGGMYITPRIIVTPMLDQKFPSAKSRRKFSRPTHSWADRPSHRSKLR